MSASTFVPHNVMVGWRHSIILNAENKSTYGVENDRNHSFSSFWVGNDRLCDTVVEQLC